MGGWVGVRVRAYVGVGGWDIKESVYVCVCVRARARLRVRKSLCMCVRLYVRLRACL